MVVQRKMIITESEKNRIRGLYGSPYMVESDVVITDWLSPDEKFVIFLDELYDITNKVKIGNIWENFDHFRFFIKHSFDVAENIPTDIKESVSKSLDNLILTESTQILTLLKPYIKEMLMVEGINDWVSGAGEWLKDTAVNASKNTQEFFSKSFSGIQKVVSGITTGQWSEVLNLIKNGAIYVARKIRSALYNPIGLILDAILVATGIGKSAQFVIWGIVVALDVYELMSGNYEDKNDSFLIRLLFTGIDMLGLVTTGLAAKSSKSIVGSMIRKFGTSTEGLSKAAKSSSKFRSILESILNSAMSASGKMSQVVKFLQTKSPMLFKFVSGILSGLGKFVNLIIKSIKSIFKLISVPGKFVEKTLGGGKLGKGVKAGINTAGLVGGYGTYEKVSSDVKNKEIINAVQSTNIKPNYNNIEW